MSEIKVTPNALPSGSFTIDLFGCEVCTYDRHLDTLITKLQEYKDSLPKPHTHAHLMELYAKDAKETDKPWERWEGKVVSGSFASWRTLQNNPVWFINTEYRRK